MTLRFKRANKASKVKPVTPAEEELRALRANAPVFFDHGGRRWRKIRFVLLTLLLVVGFFLYYAVPKAWQHDQVTAFQNPKGPTVNIADSSSGLSPAAIDAVAGKTNIPVIGKGPLVRIIHVQAETRAKNIPTTAPVKSYATILYGNQPARVLSQQERDIIGGHEFAIERYGQPTVKKQIALTFDDGPDAKYTPMILDLLAQNKAQATFFSIGANVVKNPEIAQRMVREGHLIANHTYTHIDFDSYSTTRGEQEINQTQRVISSVTGTKSSFFRLPYVGTDEQSMRDHLLGLLTAQHMGYIVASNQFDSEDWAFGTGQAEILPNLNGESQVVLLHDAGGDRTRTVAYLQKLIDEAKAKGYKFVNLNQMYPQRPSLYAPVQATLADKTSYALSSAILVWPHTIISKLFLWTVVTLFLTLGINLILATLNRRRTQYGPRPRGYNPLVSVVVSAYNEETVLESTVRSLQTSHYKNFEIIIVDDGSKDKTGVVAQRLAKQYKRVRAFSKPNGGKASGLNFGIKHANGEIIVGIDADTIFPPTTLSRLVRHFHDPEVGAVAGNVKVGNIKNMLTRWQALDYMVGINVERNAQAFLGAVMIVPGACGAWRKEAILAAGGYTHHTLAEDFDLTLSVQRLGYKVLQDNSAVSYTEVPEEVGALSKQRLRWMYGNVQAYWKHRDMLFRRRHGWVGMFILPSTIFNFMLPIVFVPILMLVALENLLAGNYMALVIFFLATIAIQAITALVGIILAGERLSMLLAVPVTRIVYNPMRTMLMYRSAYRALKGAYAGAVWNTTRTATVQYEQVAKKRANPVKVKLSQPVSQPAQVAEQE